MVNISPVPAVKMVSAYKIAHGVLVSIMFDTSTLSNGKQQFDYCSDAMQFFQ